MSRTFQFLVRGWRSVGIFVVALAGAAWLHHVFAAIVPAKSWLAWDLLLLWSWQLVLCAACLSAGAAVLCWADLNDGRRWEALARAFPLGLLVFAIGFYVLGYVGGFLPWVATVWPLLIIASCGKDLWKLCERRQWNEGHSAEGTSSAAPNLLTLLLWLLGGLGVGLTYVGVLSPDSVNYDAAWMHLVIAQDYARAGRVVPFYGDWVKSVPHLASVLHTWDFLVPGLGSTKPLRWMMCLHSEFTVFIWTLVGIAAGVNWILDRGVRGAWTVMFLFPAILAYDGNIGGAADHVLALFAVPLVWLGVRVAQSFKWRLCVLWGCLAGGALLVKLQAVYVIVPVAAYLTIRCGVGVWRTMRSGALYTRNAAGLVLRWSVMPISALVIFSLHGLHNWRVHHNPLYPFLQDIFRASEPRVPDAVTQVKYLLADWHAHPPQETSSRLIEALKLLWSFSFEPHYSFQKNAPITGSLFTLCLPFLFFVRANRRLWLCSGFALAAVFAWAMTYWVDRNLQLFMPLLVVATAALLWSAWQAGHLAKAGVVVLVGVQLIGAADVWWSGGDRVQSAITLIRGSADGRSERRYETYRKPYVELGQALPRNAIVLLHNEHGSLGINRKTLIDWAGFQGLIDYRSMRSVADLWRTYKELGVTHVVYAPTMRPAPSKQEDVLFAMFSRLYAANTQSFGGLQMFPLPKTQPPAKPLKVGALKVDGLPDGVYDLQQLGHLDAMPPQFWVAPQPLRPTSEAHVVLGEADAVLVGNNVSSEVGVQLDDRWRALVYTQGYRIFVRQSLAPAALL